MFGFYRTLLALGVVLHHFGGTKVGGMAVYAFFCLSGFLMTLLMQETYRGRIGAFAVNRFLRLYPLYWWTMALTAALLLAGLAPTREEIGFPANEAEWLKDVLYINYWRDKPQLVLTGWAVTNEIIFYALIGLGLSASKTRSLLWLAASAAFMTYAYLWVSPKSELQYFSPLAASLPFSFGAVLYHYRDALPRSAAGLVLWAVCLFGMIVWARLAPALVLRYPILIFAGLLTVSLYHAARYAPPGMQRLDSAVGHLSYPVYLNHFAAAMLLAAVVSSEQNILYGLAVFAVACVISLFSYVTIDRPVGRLRDGVRAKNSDESARVLPTPTRSAASAS